MRVVVRCYCCEMLLGSAQEPVRMMCPFCTSVMQVLDDVINYRMVVITDELFHVKYSAPLLGIPCGWQHEHSSIFRLMHDLIGVIYSAVHQQDMTFENEFHHTEPELDTTDVEAQLMQV